MRQRYTRVPETAEPWTLPDLRAKLADADDVRRELIDRAIGVDGLACKQCSNAQPGGTRHSRASPRQPWRGR